MGRSGFITFLKGVAILGVVLVHTTHSIEGVSKYIVEAMHFGAFGCQLFFLLSGYLMVGSYKRLQSCSMSVTDTLMSFYKKRYISIAPIYVIAVFFYQLLSRYIDSIGVDGFYNFSHNKCSILLNLLLLHGLDFKYLNNIVPGGWFIGTIFLFYLVFPALYLCTEKLSKRKNGLAAMLVISITINCLIQYSVRLAIGDWSMSKPGTYLYYSVFNQMPCMLCGMVLYYRKADIRNANWKFVSLFSLSVLLYYALRLHYWIYSIIPMLLGLAFMCLFDYVKGVYDRGMAKGVFFRLVEWCGKFSFAAYFTNFIGAFIMPWLVCAFLHYNGIQFEGNILYVILLMPIFGLTFMLAPMVNKLINTLRGLLT